jgi:fumarylacetoacetate (FAA) hydrolase
VRYATLDNGTPDGQLALVAEDLATCRALPGLTLQAMLDGAARPEAGPAQPFDPARCLSPLPRAYQFLDGSAYVNHVELVRRARGAEMPARFWHDPLMYQGGSDGFLAPTEPITGDPAWGMDFEAEIAVVTGPVPRGATPEQARAAIRLVMLCNDVSLRALIPDELSKGFGFVQSKPACAFSPLAVAPEALPGWDGGKLHGTLCVDLNGAAFGRADAGGDMTFDFPALIAHAAKTRALAAGSIVGSGTVSNRDADGGPGKPVAQGGRGYSCIAEQRMVETLVAGQPETPFLQPGDRIRIWMEDARGASVFGAIDQTVETTT